MILALSALDALYPDHPVCASADITGRNGNWTLELLVQEGGRVSLDHTRSLAYLYFTSAVYDLDVQLWDPRPASAVMMSSGKAKEKAMAKATWKAKAKAEFDPVAAAANAAPWQSWQAVPAEPVEPPWMTGEKRTALPWMFGGNFPWMSVA